MPTFWIATTRLLVKQNTAVQHPLQGLEDVKVCSCPHTYSSFARFTLQVTVNICEHHNCDFRPLLPAGAILDKAISLRVYSYDGYNSHSENFKLFNYNVKNIFKSLFLREKKHASQSPLKCCVGNSNLDLQHP